MMSSEASSLLSSPPSLSDHYHQCREYISLRQWQLALEGYDAFFEASQDGAVDADVALRCRNYCFRQRGLIYELELTDLDRAVECYEQLSPLNDKDRLWQCEHLADLTFSLERNEESIDWYKRCVVNSPFLRGQYMNRLGVLCFRLSRFFDALEFTRSSLVIAINNNDAAGERAAMTNLGLIYRRQGEDDIARTFFARVYHNLCETHHDKSSFLRTIEWDDTYGTDPETDLQIEVVRTPLERIPCRVRFISWFVTKVVPRCNTHLLNTLQGIFLRPWSTRQVRVTIEPFRYVDPFGDAVAEDLYIYTPATLPSPPSPLPIVLFFHGGGYVLGHPNQMDHLFKELISRVPCVIFSPNYRKAPNHRLPAALNDAKALLQYVVAEGGRRFGGDVSRITLSGESAGGNLALVLSHWLRDEGYSLVAKSDLNIIALYPAVDGSLMFAREIQNAIYVSEWMIRYFSGLCVPEISSLRSKLKSKRDRTNPQTQKTQTRQEIEDSEISLLVDSNPLPNLFRDMTNLAPTLTITCEYCLLQTEGQRYFEKGTDLNSGWEHWMMEGEVHGFITPNLAANIESNPSLVRLMGRSISDRWWDPMGRREDDEDEVEVEVEIPANDLSINRVEVDDVDVVIDVESMVMVEREREGEGDGDGEGETIVIEPFGCLYHEEGELKRGLVGLFPDALKIYPMTSASDDEEDGGSKTRLRTGDEPVFRLLYRDIFHLEAQRDLGASETRFSFRFGDEDEYIVRVMTADERAFAKELRARLDRSQ